MAQWTYQDAVTVWPWLLPLVGPPGHITQRFKGPTSGSGENGIDLGTWQGEPITSLTSGTVLSVGYYGGGGVITVESTLPRIGVASVYYQHLDEIDPKLHPGSQVVVGQYLGTAGGQLVGGKHPATCCSTGPHIEIGINAPFGANSLWRPLGPNQDPMPWLQTLVAKGPTAVDILAAQGTPIGAVPLVANNFVRGTGPVGDSFVSVEERLDELMTFELPSITNWTDWLTGGALINNIVPFLLRSLCILVALVIILAFLVNLMRPVAQAVAPAAMTAAAVGAIP